LTVGDDLRGLCFFTVWDARALLAWLSRRFLGRSWQLLAGLRAILGCLRALLAALTLLLAALGLVLAAFRTLSAPDGKNGKNKVLTRIYKVLIRKFYTKI